MIPDRLQAFLVIGSARSGTGLLRSSIDSHPHAICLGELLHANNEEVRKTNHRRYFDDQNWLRLNPEIPHAQIAINYLDKKIWPEAKPQNPKTPKPHLKHATKI